MGNARPATSARMVETAERGNGLLFTNADDRVGPELHVLHWAGGQRRSLLLASRLKLSLLLVASWG